MTIFGILWLGVIVWGFLKRDMKYMFSLTLLCMTLQCANVIVIGETGIGPQVLTSMVFVLKALVGSGGKLQYNKKYRIFIFASLMMVVVAVISCILNGILTRQLLYIAQLLTYILCFICIMLFHGEIDGETVYRILRGITIFLLVMGIVQVLTTMELLPLRAILKVLFYNDTGISVYFHHSNYKRIMSTFMEPSYFAGMIVGAFYYFLSISSKWRENYLLMAAIVIELLWTKSSTAYAAFVILGLIFILFQNRIKTSWKIAILLIAGIGFCIVYFGFYSVLDAVIFSKTESGSYRARTNMNHAAFRMFETSKLWGTGYKNVRGSSIIYSILGGMGICGLVVYLFFNCISILPIFFHTKKAVEFSPADMGIRFAVMAAFVCQMIACPDLDLCTYWFWIYVMGSSLKKVIKTV